MVLYSERNKTRLDGKFVVITGANTGIGKKTALDLAKRGARIAILCRNPEKATAAADEIKAVSTFSPSGEASVVFYKLDLASLASVRECAKEILENEDKIDVLINNAGLMYCPQWKTEDGYDLQFGTNHLGHFLLTELLRPMMLKSSASGSNPRIVIVSSLAHEFGVIDWEDVNFERRAYGEIVAYNQSKLANVMHAKELARRLEGTGVSVYVLHPGVVNTELIRHANNNWYSCLLTLIKPFVKTPIQGAQTTIYCSIEDKISQDSGKYYADCREKAAKARACVVEDNKRLWRMSEKMVGIGKGEEE